MEGGLSWDLLEERAEGLRCDYFGVCEEFEFLDRDQWELRDLMVMRMRRTALMALIDRLTCALLNSSMLVIDVMSLVLFDRFGVYIRGESSTKRQVVCRD